MHFLNTEFPFSDCRCLEGLVISVNTACFLVLSGYFFMIPGYVLVFPEYLIRVPHMAIF